MCTCVCIYIYIYIYMNTWYINNKHNAQDLRGTPSVSLSVVARDVFDETMTPQAETEIGKLLLHLLLHLILHLLLHLLLQGYFHNISRSCLQLHTFKS